MHLQHAAADREFIEAGQHDWLVMHLQWDGAKFTFKLDDGPPMVHEVLAQHAIARWRTKNGEEKWQELLLPPTAADSTSADTTASALLRRLPLLMEWLKSPLFSCLQISKDSVSSNGLVVNFFHTKLPKHCVILPVNCLQHQASLTLTPTTVYLGFLGGLFCRVKQLQNGNLLFSLRKAIYKILDKELTVNPDRPKNATHGKRLDVVLDLCLGGRPHSQHRPGAQLRQEEHALVK